MAKTKFGVRIDANLISRPESAGTVKLYSLWDVEHWRDGNMLSKTVDRNMVVNEGLNKILDVMFRGSGTAPQFSEWYVLITDTAATSPSATMTYASPTFSESTDYSEGTRPEYVEAAAASQSITNSASKASFSINGSTTIYGGALVGGGSTPSTKDDQAGGGVLFCYSLFAAAKSVVSGDTLDVAITINAADA